MQHYHRNERIHSSSVTLTDSWNVENSGATSHSPAQVQNTRSDTIGFFSYRSDPVGIVGILVVGIRSELWLAPMVGSTREFRSDSDNEDSDSFRPDPIGMKRIRLFPWESDRIESESMVGTFDLGARFQ